MDAPDRVGEIVTAFVADLTGQPLHDLPSPQASGDEWLAVLRLWLARPRLRARGDRQSGDVQLARPLDRDR